jgi:hypothetical protein
VIERRLAPRIRHGRGERRPGTRPRRLPRAFADEALRHRAERAVAEDVERTVRAEGQAQGPLGRADLGPLIDHRPRRRPGGREVYPRDMALPIQGIQRLGDRVDGQADALSTGVQDLPNGQVRVEHYRGLCPWRERLRGHEHTAEDDKPAGHKPTHPGHLQESGPDDLIPHGQPSVRRSQATPPPAQTCRSRRLRARRQRSPRTGSREDLERPCRILVCIGHYAL